jgi:CheY-like chemotaxis protein
MANILVIDDDATILDMLRQILEREGYDVAKAYNGKEAIKIYREETTDLIITDIIMPGKEGIETIIELTKEFPNIKIIAISGGGRIGAEEYLHIAKVLGAQRTLTKPIEREELLKTVREVLE